jgi:hypothetical protein
MPSKFRPPRKLWLNIEVKGRDKRLTGSDWNIVRDTLIESILRGDYRYPKNWFVKIEWRNRDDAPNKMGEFTREMNASRISSPGWDMVVIRYLRGK